MKRIVVSAALLMACAGAQAADLPTRAPLYKSPVAVQVYDWTGFYFGANAGVGLGRNLSQLTIPDTPTIIAERSRLGAAGAVGGGQIGYNWQLSNLVLGVEADLQGSAIEDNRTCGVYCEPAVPSVSARFDQKLDWFGTVRGRIGLASGPVLSYVTGGLAYGGVKTSITETLPGPRGVVGVANAGIGGTRTGWALGSGVEAALGGNWTGKIEYLYVNLGTQSAALPFTAFPGQSISSDIREHIFRVGVNYRIGGAGSNAPEPAANWTGLYIGGNGGSGTAIDKSDAPVSPTAGGVAVFDEAFNLSPAGYFGGVQIGYNWQTANWVFGFETDIQGSTQRDSKACQYICAIGATELVAYDQRLPWFGTTRARLGYSVGSSLFYATGGLAYGGVQTNVTYMLSSHANLEFSDTRIGWTVGAGIESPLELFGLFGKNWTAKTEYLYVDLGSSSDSNVLPGEYWKFTTHVQEHIFRTGLNYHFSNPVAARY
ncbi:MAG TPA: outer membrane beta-barrel protein [Bradyrhizobium sp.]|jgi:outer membrane immunogenic protein